MRLAHLSKLTGLLLLGAVFTLSACSSNPVGSEDSEQLSAVTAEGPKSFGDASDSRISGSILELNERTGELVLSDSKLIIKATDDVIVIHANQTKPNGLGSLIPGDIVDVFGQQFGETFLASEIIVRKHPSTEDGKSQR